MPNPNDIVIRLTLDPSGFLKGIDSASGQSVRFNTALSTMQGNAKNASNALGGISNTIEHAVGGMRGFVTKIGEMATGFLAAQLAMVGLSQGLEILSIVFRAAFRAVDEYKMGVASLAGLTMTFLKPLTNEDPAEMWKRSKEYAEDLYETVEKLSAQTLMTGQQVNMLVQQFIKNGVVIKTQNQEQVEGLKTIANSLFVVTGGIGLERQIMTEIDHLLKGNITAMDLLGKLVLATGRATKEDLKDWSAKGNIIEKVADILKGMAFATKDLATAWKAVSTTMTTTLNMIFRAGFSDVYADIIKNFQSLNEYLVVHREEIGQKVREAYVEFKAVVSTLWDVFSGLTKILWENKDAIKAIVAGFIAFKVATIVAAVAGVIAQFGGLTAVIVDLGFAIKYLAVTSFPALLTPIGLVAVAIGGLVYIMAKLREEQEKHKASAAQFKSDVEKIDVHQAKFSLMEYMDDLDAVQKKKEEVAKATPEYQKRAIDTVVRQSGDRAHEGFVPLGANAKEYLAISEKEAAIKRNISVIQERINDLESKGTENAKDSIEFNKKLADEAENAADKLKDKADAWGKVFSEGMQLSGVKDEIYDVQKKFSDFELQMNKAYEDIPKAARSAFSEQKRMVEENIRVAKPIEIAFATVGMDKTMEDLGRLRERIGDMNEPVSNWERDYSIAMDTIQEKTIQLWNVLDLFPEDITNLEGSFDAVTDAVIRLGKEGDNFTEKFRKSMNGVFEAMMQLKEEVMGLDIELLPEDSLGKQIRSIEKDMTGRLRGAISGWISKGLLDKGSDLEEVFNAITKSGLPASEAIKKFIKETTAADDMTNMITKIDQLKEYMEESAKIKVSSEQEIQRTDLMREQASLMKEAYELTGQWDEARRAGIQILELENKLTLKRLEMERDLIKLQIQKLALSDPEVNRLQDIVDIYEEIIDAQSKVGQIKVQQAQFRLENPLASAIDDVNKQWKDANQQMYDISKSTYEGMASAFSSIFFDGMKNQLKSFDDYFQSIWDNILRYFTDIVGRMVAKYIAGLLGMQEAEQTANLGSNLTGGTGGTGGGVLGKVWDFAKGFLGGGTATSGSGLSGYSLTGASPLQYNNYGVTSGAAGMLSVNQNLMNGISGLSSSVSGLSSGVSSLSSSFQGLSSLSANPSLMSAYGGSGMPSGVASQGASAGLGAGSYALAGVGALVGGYNYYQQFKAGKMSPLSGAVSGATVGGSIGSIIPGVGTIIGAVVGAVVGAVGSLFSKDKEKPTFQATYKGDGEWGFRGRHGLDLNMAQKRQLENAFEDYRDVLKRYVKVTNRDADVLEKPLKLGEFDVDEDGINKAITGSFKQFAKFTVGEDYFNALKNAGEKFEDTVKRVVAGLEALDAVGHSVSSLIKKLNALGTPLEDTIDSIISAEDQFNNAKDVIDAGWDDFFKEVEEGIGGNLYILATQLKKGMAKVGGLDITDPKMFEKFSKRIKDKDIIDLFSDLISGIETGKGNMKDAILKLKPMIADDLAGASTEVQEAFTKFFADIEGISDKLTFAQVSAKVRQAINNLVKDLTKVTDPTVDPEKLAKEGAALVAAMEAQINAVISLRDLYLSLTAALEALDGEMTDFFVTAQNKIEELRGTTSTKGSDAIAKYAVKNIVLPLQEDAANRAAKIAWDAAEKAKAEAPQKFIGPFESPPYEAKAWQGPELLSGEERLALVQAGMDAVDNWLAQRTTEIEAKYALMTESNDAQIEILNKQLDVMEAWNSLLDSVQDTIDELSMGASNPANIVERLALAKENVAKLKAQFEGATGEQKAQYGQDYLAALKNYLSLAKDAGETMAEYQGPGAEYGKIYDFVMEELNMLKDAAIAQGGTDEQILDVQNRIAGFEEANNELQKSMEKELKALNLEAAGYYEWLQGAGMLAYEQIGKDLQENIDVVSQTLLDLLGEGSSLDTLMKDIDTWIKEQSALLRDLKIAIDSFKDSLNPEAKASGGYVDKPTLALIGEAGPEWVIPENKIKEFYEQMKKAGVLQKEEWGNPTVSLANLMLGGVKPYQGSSGKSGGNTVFNMKFETIEKSLAELVELTAKEKGAGDSEISKEQIDKLKEMTSILDALKAQENEFQKTNFKYQEKTDTIQNSMDQSIKEVVMMSGDSSDWMKTDLVALYMEWKMSLLSDILRLNKTLETELSELEKIPIMLDKLIAQNSDVPAFASGGYVTKPTYALIGEKEPEWVVPESKVGTYIKQMEATMPEKFSGGTPWDSSGIKDIGFSDPWNVGMSDPTKGLPNFSSLMTPTTKPIVPSGFAMPDKSDVNYKGSVKNLDGLLRSEFGNIPKGAVNTNNSSTQTNSKEEYNVSLVFQPAITVEKGTKPKEFAKEMEVVFVKSLESGKAREAVKDLIKKRYQ